jgi:cell division protein FtsZ
MTINLSAPKTTELKPRIVVIGVGGAGGNAVNNMISSGLEGVDFIVANTDAQALALNQAERTIQLGANITQGLGCGARPDIGRAAAEEAIDQIIDHMTGTHMAFITAGMGGGTGTGAAPVIAEALRDQGILTVGVVTKPFQFEGSHRMTCAEQGIEELQSFVDTLIIIPNQNLFRIANEKTTFADAFTMADNVLHSGVRGITDLMVQPGLINLDFADVRTVMAEMGKAMMGTGEAEGEKRAIDAAEAAISNPLLDDVSMKGARGVLINITGGMDLTLYEVDEAANRVREEVDPDANIIVGSALDDSLNGRMRVSVVATGIELGATGVRPMPMKPRLAAIAGHALAEDKSAPAAAAPAAEIRTPAVSESAAPSMPVAAATPAPAMPEPVQQPNLAAAVAHQPEERVAVPPQPVAETAPAPVAADTDTLETPEDPDLLTLSMAEQVPPPKPIQPAPEPMATRTPAAPEEPVRQAAFVAPRPEQPRTQRVTLGRPTPMAEAEVMNATQSSAPKKGLGKWLFGRRTEGAAGAESPEPAAPKAEPHAKPAAKMDSPPLKAPEPVDRLAPMEEEDLLEIPSFLRRQAN